MELALEGIIPAVHTAFDAGEDLDLEALRRLVRKLVADGVDGVFLCGTSGEFPLLSLDERERIVEVAAGELSGRAALLVHVGAPSTRDAIRLARHAARSGAAAVASVPPPYYPYRREAVIDYVRDVASATPIPFLYYHIPERTGIAIDEAFTGRLLAIPNVKGMKFSHGDLGLAERIVKMAGPGFRLFCGSDEILLDALERGAAGGIGSTYNFLAPMFLEMLRAFRGKRDAEARDLQARANRIMAALAPYPAIAAGKEAVRLAGIDLGPPRRPLERLTEEEKASLQRDLAAAGWAPAAR
jgi:N-acetylneuraminate lyase